MNHPLYPVSRAWIAISAAVVCTALANAAPTVTSSAIPVKKAPLVVVVDTPPPPAPEGVPLRLGLHRAEIREMLGRPAAVRPIELDNARAEVWVYSRNALSNVRQASTRTQDVPWIDPITGELRMLKEPVFEYVSESVKVELRLLMFRGQLINWAEVPVDVSRNFN